MTGKKAQKENVNLEAFPASLLNTSRIVQKKTLCCTHLVLYATPQGCIISKENRPGKTSPPSRNTTCQVVDRSAEWNQATSDVRRRPNTKPKSHGRRERRAVQSSTFKMWSPPPPCLHAAKSRLSGRMLPLVPNFPFGTGSGAIWYWTSPFGTGPDDLVLVQRIWYWKKVFGIRIIISPCAAGHLLLISYLCTWSGFGEPQNRLFLAEAKPSLKKPVLRFPKKPTRHIHGDRKSVV